VGGEAGGDGAAGRVVEDIRWAGSAAGASGGGGPGWSGGGEGEVGGGGRGRWRADGAEQWTAARRMVGRGR